MAPGTMDCQRLRGFTWADIAFAEEPVAEPGFADPVSVSCTSRRWLLVVTDVGHCASRPGEASALTRSDAVATDSSRSVLLLQGDDSALACKLPTSMDNSPACAASANSRAKKLARTRLVVRDVMLRLRGAARD
jgi:hypothetical protein